ncbi:hypothetical protein, partial [Pseudomonas sp. 2848]|uniref:hypothetical protein n=1 Tax=Pseudomonas sp. 2848 TaxID=2183926 RepID=UPI001C447E49
ISRSGRRIIQRYNLLSTAFFTAADQMTEALPILPETLNLLINKRFCVSTTSEVGRIIRGSETPSTFYYRIMMLDRRKAARRSIILNLVY